MFARSESATPTLGELAVMDGLMKKATFAENWLVSELIGEGFKPAELRTGILKRVRGKIQADANQLMPLAELLRDQLKSDRIWDLLAPYRDRQPPIDLENLEAAFGEGVDVWVITEAAMSELSALSIEYLATLASEFLQEEKPQLVEESPGWMMSVADAGSESIDAPRPLLEKVLVELARDGLLLGGNVDGKNFLDLLLCALTTKRNATAKFKQQQAARQAVKQSTEAAAAKRDPARRPHHQATSTTSPIAEQI